MTTVYLKPLVSFAQRIGWPLKIVYRQTSPELKHVTKDELLEALDDKESNRRLFILTEGATTNGRVGYIFL